jgi:uncharacterized protein (DUF1778 family)
MHEAAVKTMEEHELLSLSAQEQRVFVQVLLNPPTPNNALRAATKRYKKMTGR